MNISNKQIHLSRGLCWHEGRPYQMECNKCGEPSGFDHPSKYNPDYLGNIADAWQLFMELPIDKKLTEWQDKKQQVFGMYWGGKLASKAPKWKPEWKYESALGKTPMEAICRAFKAWKGEK